MEGQTIRGSGQNDRETIMKTFKEFRESIGYSTKFEIVEKEKIDIIEGDVVDQLRSIIKKKKESDIKFKSGTSVPIDPESAKSILKTFDSLNSSKQKKMRDNMNKDTKSFMTIMDFALENVIKQDGNMKLICELQESVDYELIEEGDGKPKQYYIEGIFMQSEKKNKNGRIYPLPILEKEVSRYVKEYVEPKRAFGELGHPDGPTVNLDRA